MGSQASEGRDAALDPDVLLDWTTAVFAACGVSAAPARRTAQLLLRTSLRGIDTHGLSRVPGYVDKLLSAEVNPQAQPRVELRHGVLHVEGDGGLGQVVASEALREAMARARETAVVTCVLRGSGHLSALGVLVLEAAEQGLVAVLCQKTPPIMALPGARGGAIGNNPLAFAMPVAGEVPLVFDMASSVVARGHVMQAVQEHRAEIPPDWAIGPDGKPTTDPLAALQGAMLPVAGHKGIGLAMLVECLAGSLNGDLGGAPAGLGGSPSHVSAFMLVMNPALFLGQSAFDASVRAWLDHYLHTAGPDARYPGQRQARCEQDRRVSGIPVPAGLLAELCRAGARVGVPLVFAG